MPPDENRGPEILAVCGALVGLALVVVLLRVYVRAKMVRHLGIDDYTIIGAMVCTSSPPGTQVLLIGALFAWHLANPMQTASHVC
jgi:hypothetical protein